MFGSLRGLVATGLILRNSSSSAACTLRRIRARKPRATFCIMTAASSWVSGMPILERLSSSCLDFFMEFIM